MDVLTGLSKAGEPLRTMIVDQGRSELSGSLVRPVLRVAGEVREAIQRQQGGLAVPLDVARQHEQAARAQVIAALRRLATEPRLQRTGPAVQAEDSSTPRVVASSAEIRAWAREHHLAVGDRGIISKRVMEAYALAHAS